MLETHREGEGWNRTGRRWNDEQRQERGTEEERKERRRDEAEMVNPFTAD
jgi:hypothetical protein